MLLLYHVVKCILPEVLWLILIMRRSLQVFYQIGYVAARYTVSQQVKATLGQVGLLARMIISATIAKFGQQASQGLGLLFLKFVRYAERQSDELGGEYSIKIDYDAHQMADFLEH
jgi:predicted Zn-dependent protease